MSVSSSRRTRLRAGAGVMVDGLRLAGRVPGYHQTRAPYSQGHDDSKDVRELQAIALVAYETMTEAKSRIREPRRPVSVALSRVVASRDHVAQCSTIHQIREVHRITTLGLAPKSPDHDYRKPMILFEWESPWASSASLAIQARMTGPAPFGVPSVTVACYGHKWSVAYSSHSREKVKPSEASAASHLESSGTRFATCSDVLVVAFDSERGRLARSFGTEASTRRIRFLLRVATRESSVVAVHVSPESSTHSYVSSGPGPRLKQRVAS